jgi:hypothetical protein
MSDHNTRSIFEEILLSLDIPNRPTKRQKPVTRILVNGSTGKNPCARPSARIFIPKAPSASALSCVP